MAQRYRVSGPNRVFGREPGTTFEREIPAEQEARLLASGALTRTKKPARASASSRRGRRQDAEPTSVSAPAPAERDEPIKPAADEAPDPAPNEE